MTLNNNVYDVKRRASLCWPRRGSLFIAAVAFQIIWRLLAVAIVVRREGAAARRGLRRQWRRSWPCWCGEKPARIIISSRRMCGR